MKNVLNLNKLLKLNQSLYEDFHSNTKINQFTGKTISLQTTPNEWKNIYFKGYARLKEVPMPSPSLSKNTSLLQALFMRKSLRKFSEKPMRLQTLSNLLYYSAGIRSMIHPIGSDRFYPSGGARYPLELYLLSINSELPKGLYHYYLKNNSLEYLNSFSKYRYRDYFRQPWLAKASCLLVLTAVFNRTTIKYDQRGYRYVLLEAGHLGQNIYLMSAVENVSCCAIGGCKDRAIEKILDIDGVSESVVYVFSLGNMPD